MAGKKESKASKASLAKSPELDSFGKIGSAADLKAFLSTVLEKLKEDASPAIYAASAMNYVLNLPEVYSYLSNENRELARDIWLRLKQSGLQLRNPPALFDDGDAVVDVL